MRFFERLPGKEKGKKATGMADLNVHVIAEWSSRRSYTDGPIHLACRPAAPLQRQ